MGAVTRLCMAAVCCVALASCGATARPGESARLVLAVVPLESSVALDDAFVGRGAKLQHNALLMKPGHHRISVTANGYFPHDFEVDLPVGTTRATVKLRPIPQ